MNIIETHIACKQEVLIRFQEYAVGIFKTIATKSAVKKAIKKELIFIDGILATTSKYISGGEKIELFEAKNSATSKVLKLNLEVLYEDDYLAIIYKPAGILVSGNQFVSIKNALSQNLKNSTKSDAVNPQPIHRLDYPTSGVLLVGKTSTSIQQLNKLFEFKEISKTYIAITVGKMCSAGTINLKVNGKNASTNFKVLKSLDSKRFEALNLVQLDPKTGRKHQLRKHLSAIGHQILGDKVYGIENLKLKGKGLYLHAFKLEFTHPFTKEKISISKEIPKKFKKLFPEF